MDISNACLPPVQPEAGETQRSHPRYGQYRQYVAALSRQLVTAAPFARWLSDLEEFEKGKIIVFKVERPGAKLSPGWYKNIFHAGQIYPVCLGPFTTEDAAKDAVEL